MCVCGDVEGHGPLRALVPFVTGCLLFVTGCLWSFVTGCLWSFVPGCLLLVTGCRPLLTGAGFLQSSWLFPKARELFRRCRPCTSARKSRKTPCVHRHQSTKPLPKCSQCVPRKRFFRMLLLAMWPEAKLLRCQRCQRNIFEERSTVCVCVCEDVEGHDPRIRSGPEAPPYLQVQGSFRVPGCSRRPENFLGDVDHAPLPESQGRPHVCTGTNPRNLYRSVTSVFRGRGFLECCCWPCGPRPSC